MPMRWSISLPAARALPVRVSPIRTGSRPLASGERTRGACSGRQRTAGLALAVLLLAGGPVRAAGVDLYAPRAFGYFIGDTLVLEAVVHLDAGWQLDASALPRPRRVTYWLDLKRLDVQPERAPDGTPRYRLTLTYQTFYAPLEPRALDIPAVPLAARKGDARQTLTIPAWTFVSSPLREIVASQRGSPMALQPDIRPRPYPLTPDVRIAAAAAVVAGASLLAFAAASGWGPFAGRKRPFAAALRQMRRADLAAPAGYGDALQSLHRAFDAAAGQRLFGEDVPAFLAATPALAGEAEAIARFFAASRTAFFGDAPAAAMAYLPPDELRALARRLVAIERQGGMRPGGMRREAA